MATPLNDTILPIITPIFVFLLIFTLLYALLKKSGFFGDKFGFNAAIAFAAAMLFLIVPEAQTVVQVFTPWVIVLLFFTLFAFMFFIFLGAKEKDLQDLVKEASFYPWMIIALIILFLIALTKALGPFLMVNQYPGFWNATKRVIFHPRTLGALFILAIAAFSIRYIASHEKN